MAEAFYYCEQFIVVDFIIALYYDYFSGKIYYGYLTFFEQLKKNTRNNVIKKVNF